MKTKSIIPVVATLFLASTLLGASGCAHSAHSRGSVVVKHSDEEGDVCLGSGEVATGDKVSLFKSECKRGTHIRRTGNGMRCTKVKVGDGEISQVLDEHYSSVRVNSGVPFDVGTIVEKN